MVFRIWHGWTAPEDADAYEELLREEVIAGIRARDIPGFRGIKLLRDDTEAESEFVTIMEFDDIESVRKFAGDEYERAVVPEKARRILKRFEERSSHYELREL